MILRAMPIRHLLFSLLLLAPTLVPAQEVEPTRHDLHDDLHVVQLTDAVWRFVSYQDQGGEWGRIPANGLIVVSGDTAALLDTPWTDEQTRLLFAWVESELCAKIDAVVPTHSHGDCLGGLGAAHELGARSYGHEMTAEFARRDGNPAPQTTFRDRLEVSVGEHRLELRHLGAGHTLDNVVVWIAQEKILFGGCLIKSAQTRHMGYVDEADLEAWPETIANVRTEYGDAVWIVPGHGSPGGADTLRRTLELIEEYRRSR